MTPDPTYTTLHKSNIPNQYLRRKGTFFEKLQAAYYLMRGEAVLHNVKIYLDGDRINIDFKGNINILNTEIIDTTFCLIRGSVK